MGAPTEPPCHWCSGLRFRPFHLEVEIEGAFADPLGRNEKNRGKQVGLRHGEIDFSVQVA